MKVIAIANHKGGTGKTTTTINVGAALARRGKKVLLVDLDPQGNLTEGFGLVEPEVQVVDALLDEADLPILEVGLDLWVAPSDLDLMEAELQLVNKIAGFKKLHNALVKVKDEFDFCLIDTGPTLNILVQNALYASDGLIIPMTPAINSVKGMRRILSVLNDLREVDVSVDVLGGIFTIVDSRQVIQREAMEAVRQEIKTFDTIIKNRVQIKEAEANNCSIFDYSPNGESAQEFDQIALEILKEEEAYGEA